MSASRHTYAVILHRNVNRIGECSILCRLHDGTCATGSKKVAQRTADDLAKGFPDETYTVKQLR